jgi:hypothetical protein
MGLHKSQDIHLVTIDGNVKRGGGALKLAMGQLGVIDLSKGPTAAGAFVVDDFNQLNNRSKLELRLGKANVGVTRSLDNKPYTSIPFTLSDIVDLRVDAPSIAGIGKDDFIIGFNGTAGTGIELDNGDNEIIQLTLEGKAMEYLGYVDGCVTVQVQIEAPNLGVKGTDWYIQEIIEEAFEVFKNYELIGQVKLSDYVDMFLVNSENTALAGGTQFWTLTVPCDNGTFSNLGRVQAQYPDLDVKVQSVNEGTTTYVAIAGSQPADYSTSLADIIKGCEACPPGYSELNDGFVYQITLEDDGVDETATVEGISANVEAGSGSKNEQIDGVGFYTVVVTQELTQVEIDAFITANPTATVELIAKDVAELCRNTTTTDTAWVQGAECTQETQRYTITLADDECGNSILAKLQAHYAGQLTIAEVSGSEAGCQRTYETTVVTNVICNECDPIFGDVFVSEAPADFDLKPWIKDAPTYSDTAEMGIRFRAKDNILSGSEEYRDDMSFVAESVRLGLVGGFPTNINESYNMGENGRMVVTLLDRYAPPVNFGGNLRNFEDMSQVYFRNTHRHEGNNYAKYVFGEETRLDGTKQYVDYIFTIEPSRTQGGVTQRVFEKRTYHILVEVGRHEAVESLLNELVNAAGLPGVQAYAKS